jgi:glutamyl-tRNA synthetase
MDSADEKLSKTAGATSIWYLRRQGVKPDEIFSMIVRQLGTKNSASTWEEMADVVGNI